ncbi:hypothetical protein PY02_00325, partial [Staphylococcus aureus]
IVGDIFPIDRIVRRDQVDDQQEVRRGLARHDAQALHFLGQARNRDRDPVLHQHLRGIEIGPRFERDGDGDVAVAGRLRRLVEHVVDAVDLLLDRRGDRLGDGLGRSAGIGGGDRHRRGDDVGILGNRQRQIGDRTDDRDHDRDDGREDRARDE